MSFGQDEMEVISPDLVSVIPADYQQGIPVRDLNATARARVEALCARRPELFARLESKYPLASAFMRSGCATPQAMAGLRGFRGVGQDDAAEVEQELTALETELATEPVTTAEVNDYFARVSDYASGGIDWAAANPLLAIGVGLGLLMLFSGKRR